MKKKQKNIFIIGPVGILGGVRTHVEILKEILQPYADCIAVSRGLKVVDFCKHVIGGNTELIIFNLSVYRNQVYKNIFFALLFNRWFKISILHLHGGSFNGIKFGYVSRFILKYYLNSFQKVFCLTDEQYDFVTSVVGSTASVEKIFNYVNIPSHEKIIKDENHIDLLYVGRLHPDKGVMEIINAVKMLNDPRIRLTIIGSGELEREVSLSAGDTITFLGKLFGEEKDKYFYKSHVFLLPSQHNEGLPYALLEAASSGQVLVASNVGAINEVLKNGVNGFLVTPRDTQQVTDVLNQLLSDRSLLNKMGQASRELAEQHFSVEQLKTIYSQVLSHYS